MLTASKPPPVTTETFQKHYGRGSIGYPDDRHHQPQYNHNGHPSSQQSYYPPHYASSNTGHPHPPPYHSGPPPGPGYHHPSPWYYPPQNAPVPVAVPPPRDRSSADALLRTSNNPNNAPPILVTPKSHDSETMPPLVGGSNISSANKKQITAKSVTKRTTKCKKKESEIKSPILSDERDLEMEEETKVKPMKQDFHFYAMDHYEEVNRICQQQLDESFTDGSIAEKNKENQLFLLTTMLNSRLIKNWENAPPSTRAQYLKKEEADRKRFMGEEEIASRHCATLTARKRSPKQSGMERVESFGLTSAIDVPALAVPSTSGEKRTSDEANLDERSSNIFEAAV